jgi:hypothetical protein
MRDWRALRSAPGSSQAFAAAEGRMTGIRSWTGAQTGFADVVRIAHVSSSSRCSHRPARKCSRGNIGGKRSRRQHPSHQSQSGAGQQSQQPHPQQRTLASRHEGSLGCSPSRADGDAGKAIPGC